MTEEDKKKQPTEAELDAIMNEILPIGERKYTPKPGEASQEELDEIFKHMNI